MRKTLFLLLVLIVAYANLDAQYRTVVFESEKNYFNQGQALPAETPIMLTGETEENIKLVEVSIFKDDVDKVLYKTYWKRGNKNTGAQYQIPINYQLKGDKSYGWSIESFSLRNKNEKLLKSCKRDLNTYLQNMLVTDKSKELKIARKQEKVILENMNQIISEKLQDYRNNKMQKFPGFSTLIATKIEQIVKGKMSIQDQVGSEVAIVTTEEGKPNKRAQKKTRDVAKNLNQSQNQLSSLIELAMQDLNSFTEDGIYVLESQQIITNYPVAQTNNSIALNVGYGGSYLSGDWDDFSSVSGPFVGLSVPLSSSSLSPAIVRNTSISAGVFLKNMESSEGHEITGPFINRPFYAALGYKILPFIRLNIGGNVLQQNTRGSTGEVSSEVFLKPFVGFSAEFNLSLNISK